MNGIDVLYYPDFYPSIRWLSTYLLFFEKVKTIIPNDVNYPPPIAVKKFIRKVPNSLEKISPKKRDIEFDLDRLNYIETAFKIISKKIRNRPLVVKMHKNNQTEYVGYTFLHNKKVTPRILGLLEKYNLLLCDTKGLEEFGIHYEGHWYIVDKKAANILVSNIADKIGYNSGLNTITEKRLDFIFNSVPSFDFQSIQRPDTMLTNAIINCEIPKEIHSINIAQYAEIRENYSPVRELIPEVISNFSNVYLKNIHDKKILADEIKRITSEFHTEIQESKKICIKQGIKDWGIFSVASMITLGAAAFTSSDILIPLAGGSVILNAIQLGLKKDLPIHPSKKQIQKLIGNMQKEIIRAKDVREFIQSENQ